MDSDGQSVQMRVSTNHKTDIMQSLAIWKKKTSLQEK